MPVPQERGQINSRIVGKTDEPKSEYEEFDPGSG